MSGPLLSATELHRRLGAVRVLDLRWDLADPTGGRERYRAAHIPGAVFVDLEEDLTGDDGPGRHPLPTASEFATTLGRLGVQPQTDVVVYDDAGGSVASRLWWMLGAIGHAGAVRLLDGGWQAWERAGYDIATGEVSPVPADYPDPGSGYEGVVERETVARGEVLLIDARSPERYRGESEPVDPRAGHIPGAVNVPWTLNLTEDGRFLDADELHERYRALGADREPVVVSCGSGVTSCHVAVALEVAGFARPLLYPGSFSDWSRSELPVVEGPEPR